MTKISAAFVLTLAATLCTTSMSAMANHTGTGVYLNGVEMSAQQIQLYTQSTGIVPRQGHYVAANGCVAHLESGQVACQQVEYGGGIGGGYGYSNGAEGAWFNRGSDYAGGYSVGGDGSGCIYTPNWSNC